MATLRHVCAAAALALAAGPAGARDKLHIWKDRDGVTHVDDVPRGPGSKAAGGKAAKGPAGAAKAARPRRWWERSNDAPPPQIDRAARLYNIPAELIRAVIAVESAGDTSAVSRKGAVGLMQLMPQTAGRMYVQDPVDPAQNILGGTRYLRTLANQFNGDMMLVLAAYNAGPDAVRKHGGVPPFDETRQYVRKVMNFYADYKRETQRPSRQIAAIAERVRAREEQESRQ